MIPSRYSARPPRVSARLQAGEWWAICNLRMVVGKIGEYYTLEVKI